MGHAEFPHHLPHRRVPLRLRHLRPVAHPQAGVPRIHDPAGRGRRPLSRLGRALAHRRAFGPAGRAGDRRRRAALLRERGGRADQCSGLPVAAHEPEQLRQPLSGQRPRPAAGRSDAAAHGRQLGIPRSAGRRDAAVALRAGGLLPRHGPAARHGLRDGAGVFPPAQQLRRADRHRPRRRGVPRHPERHAVDLGHRPDKPPRLLQDGLQQHDPLHRPLVDRLRQRRLPVAPARPRAAAARRPGAASRSNRQRPRRQHFGHPVPPQDGVFRIRHRVGRRRYFAARVPAACPLQLFFVSLHEKQAHAIFLWQTIPFSTGWTA